MKNKQSFSTNKSGLSLLEVIISMGVSVVLVAGLVLAVTTAIRNSQFARSETLATKLAQEGLEKIRAYRDQNNWVTFTSSCANLATMGIAAPPSPFTRTVTCVDTAPVDADKRKVTVTVAWTDPTGTHQSQLSSYFSNQSLWK